MHHQQGPTADSGLRQVAAGTDHNPANPTVPWVAGDEFIGGVHKIFVAAGRTGTAADEYGAISVANDATRPDITSFSAICHDTYGVFAENVMSGRVAPFAPEIGAPLLTIWK